MDPISSTDRLALLLRQRLLERAKRAAGTARSDVGRVQTPGASGTAALASLPPQQQRRELIESILLSQLGDGLKNDARFQRIVDQVGEALARDDQSAKLVEQVLADLGGTGGG